MKPNTRYNALKQILDRPRHAAWTNTCDGATHAVRDVIQGVVWGDNRVDAEVGAQVEFHVEEMAYIRRGR